MCSLKCGTDRIFSAFEVIPDESTPQFHFVRSLTLHKSDPFLLLLHSITCSDKKDEKEVVELYGRKVSNAKTLSHTNYYPQQWCQGFCGLQRVSRSRSWRVSPLAKVFISFANSPTGRFDPSSDNYQSQRTTYSRWIVLWACAKYTQYNLAYSDSVLSYGLNPRISHLTSNLWVA